MDNNASDDRAASLIETHNNKRLATRILTSYSHLTGRLVGLLASHFGLASKRFIGSEKGSKLTDNLVNTSAPTAHAVSVAAGASKATNPIALFMLAGSLLLDLAPDEKGRRFSAFLAGFSEGRTRYESPEASV